MSTARLTFLYPHLLRAAAGGRARVVAVGDARPAAALGSKRWNASSGSGSGFARRRGKAVEPQQDQQQDQQQAEAEAQSQPGLPAHSTSTAAQPPMTTPESRADEEDKELVKIGQLFGGEDASAAGTAQEGSSKHAEPASTSAMEASLASTLSQTAASSASANTESATPAASSSQTNMSEPSPTNRSESNEEDPDEERARQTREEAKQSGPLEAVLHMPSPKTVARQHPTMSPPRYVHHFDSYSLVKQLQQGGYTQKQAIEVMKGVRMLLAQNLDVAQEGLVSKSDVENETYLFRAACSELSTEIKNNRRIQDEQIRQQRSHLQYEMDILNQSVSQELLTLNDNVKGLFNDRSMAVREQQKGIDSAIQQANYKISIMLTSDAKSEIEGVRWVLIRRSVLGIIFMAIMTLGTLRYATYVSHERKREAEMRKKMEEDEAKHGGISRQRMESSSAGDPESDAAVVLAASGGGG